MLNNDRHDTTLRRLLGGEHLSVDETAALIGSIMDGTISQERAGEILLALAQKGEHHDEVYGAASAMRSRSIRVEHDLPVVVDVVGTGGDGAGTINISTIASLVVAAAGVPVAKHGNRASSSTCGSADVLEANGLPLSVDPQVASRMLREAGFAFLFAPLYHPAMKTVAAVRKQLGIRTIFNLLGPLTNPARATHYVIGVARREHLDVIVHALQRSGSPSAASSLRADSARDSIAHIRSVAVVHGHGNVDEITGSGPAEIYILGDIVGETCARQVHRQILNPADLNVNATLEDLRGDSIEACAQAFRAILSGERSPRADVVALNAGLALHVAGRVSTLRAGIALAREVIASGQGLRIFEKAKAIAMSEAA